MKRFLSLLLVFVMVLAMVPTYAPAAVAADDTTYTVTFTAKNASNRNLTYASIRVDRVLAGGTETVTYLTTNNSGTATYDLPNGTYRAYVSYVSNRTVYYDEVEFTVNGAAAAVSMTANKTDSSVTTYERTYINTTYFNHVDIRVKGTYTTGTTIDLSEYDIYLSNVRVTVVHDPAQGHSDYNESETFTNSTSYEWRIDDWGTRVYKDAVITIMADIFVDANHNGRYDNGERLIEDYAESFSGQDDFVKAIEQCDGKQGLDFILNPADILEAVFADVTYQWSVSDADAALAADLEAKLNAIANPPAGATDLEENAAYTVDTTWTEGIHYILQADDGTYYRLHFNGWTQYSNETTEKTGFTGTRLTITSDTVIYGVWTVEPLPDAKAHIALVKEINIDGVNKTAEIMRQDMPGHWIAVENPDGTVNEVEFTQMELKGSDSTGYYLYYAYPVSEDGTYTISETAPADDGYEWSYTVQAMTNMANAAAGENVQGGAFTPSATGVQNAKTIDVEITIPQTTDGSQVSLLLGTVGFVNNYTKVIGEPVTVHNYPHIRLNKLDADTRASLQGASFKLIPWAGTGSTNSNPATTPAAAAADGTTLLQGTTDKSGYIYFLNIPGSTTGPVVYELIETEAPAGYIKGYALYKVIVSPQANPVVEEVLVGGKWCQRTTYNYTIDVLVSLDGGATWTESQHFSYGTTGTRYRLAAFNEKLTGSLTIKKEITGYYSPVTFEDDIVVRVTGPDGYVKVITLNNANGWETTLTDLAPGDYTISESGHDVGGCTVTATWAGKDVSAAEETAASITINIGEDDLPAGYAQDNPVAREAVTITNHYVRNTAEDVHIYPDLHLQKFRTDTTEPLNGAEFTLTRIKDGSGAAVNETGVKLATSSGGKLTFADLQPGVYKLEETKAPDTYEKDATVYYVSVTPNVPVHVDPDNGDPAYDLYTYAIKVTTDEAGSTPADNFTENGTLLTVYNKKTVGTVTVYKRFGTDSALTENNVTGGFTVSIYEYDAATNTIGATPLETLDLTRSGGGIAVFGAGQTPLATDKTYAIVEENGARQGFCWNVDFSSKTTLADGTVVGLVTITHTHEHASFTVINSYTTDVHNPASFTIEKVDSVTGAPIQGVGFALYNGAGLQVGDIVYTDANGHAAFTGFYQAAEYTLKEVSAPADYIKTDKTWTVQITLKEGDPTVSVQANTGLLENIYNWLAGVQGETLVNGVLTIENTKKTSSLTITKNVEYYVNGQPVQAIEQYADAAFTFNVTLDGQTQTITLKNGQSHTIDNIPYGTVYTVEEVIPADAAWYMAEAEGMTGTIGDTAAAASVTNVFSLQTATIDIYKYGSDTKKPLEGAEYTLYADEDCTTVVSTGTPSDDNGRMTYEIDGEGTYYLKETKAPNGYQVDPTVFEIVVTATMGADDAGNGLIILSAAAGTNKLEGEYYVVFDDPRTTVKTGDETELLPWLGLMGAGAVGAAGLAIFHISRRKEEEN